MKKKTNTIQFQIEEPCHENWNAMTPLPGGRFCSSCEKTVVDFTGMTDNELIRFFQKNNGKVCGQVRSNQLNRAMPMPPKTTNFTRWKAMAAVVAGLLVWTPSNAQSGILIPVKTEQSTKIKRNCKKTSMNPNQKFVGFIKDETGEPMIGATVLLADGKGTTTDVNGRYELVIPADWESFELTFSYIGYETQVIEFEKKDLHNNKIANLQMNFASNKLNEVVVVANNSGNSIRGYLAGGMTRVYTESVKQDLEAEKNEEAIETLSIVQVFPNPFIENITVQLNIQKEDRYLLHLYNLNGQLVWAKTFSLLKGEQKVDLDFGHLNLTTGNYFLRLTDGEREIQTKKIIKLNLD